MGRVGVPITRPFQPLGKPSTATSAWQARTGARPSPPDAFQEEVGGVASAAAFCERAFPPEDAARAPPEEDFFDVFLVGPRFFAEAAFDARFFGADVRVDGFLPADFLVGRFFVARFFADDGFVAARVSDPPSRRACSARLPSPRNCAITASRSWPGRCVPCSQL